MSEVTGTPARSPAERPEVLLAASPAGEDGDGGDESIGRPAKVMRVGSMLKRLLKEVRSIELDEASRQRLREIYDQSIREVSSALSQDLRDELTRLTSPFDQGETPSAAELHVAKAQLMGWLEGLIRGMQAMLFAQEMAARHQLEAMRAELPAGRPGPSPAEAHTDERPGTYL